MSTPWSARREVSPENSRLLIERAHEEILAGNTADLRLRDVRPLVRDSWRRAVEHLVGVEALPPLALAPADLDEYRRTHPLAIVMDMVRGLLLPGDPAESGVVVAVGDADGRLLWVEGDHRVRTLTGEMGFVEGANWSEDVVGTAAPGTALRLDRSVQIHGAEHFNRLVQPWSCTAAPVHDPESRRILGVIDVTGEAEAASPQAQLLVDATARAIEGELMLSRLRDRSSRPAKPGRADRQGRRHTSGSSTGRGMLEVLGRDRGVLTVGSDEHTSVLELSARHAEIMLMLATHRQGLSAERLAMLVYGDETFADTIRPEMVRLRRVLEAADPAVVPESRPYRIAAGVQTDAQQVLRLLDRGAHRVALATYTGDVLPDSVAPGVEQFREMMRGTLREALMAEASVEVLLAYADTDAGADDPDVLRLCLQMLPPRSPKRAGLVTRLERLERTG